MKIIGWNYPETGSLRDLVEKAKLYPITALQSLSQSQKQSLLDQRIVLCKTICKNQNLLNQFDISDDKKNNLKDELNFVCNII